LSVVFDVLRSEF